MLSAPVHLDICEVLCLNKSGRPPRSCGEVQPGESQEDCIRKHLNHVAATRDEAHQMDINTISNFLCGKPTGFMSRLKLMLSSSKGKSSWQCCPNSTEVTPGCALDASQDSSATSRIRRTLRSQPRRQGRIADSTTKKQPRRPPRDQDLSELQWIKDHRIRIGDRHIELCCHLRDGTDVWVRESSVQEASNAAVCTYWGCGSDAEWKLADEESKRPGLENVPDSIPPEPLKAMAYREANTEVLLQMVGYPASRSQWMSVEDVKAQWPDFYEKCCSEPHVSSAQTTANCMTPESRQTGDLQTIVGHRLLEDNDGSCKFQLSCQWALGLETWEYEADVQRTQNAAVLTYWNSESDCRKGEVPDCCLRILAHKQGKLEVQWVGFSQCKKDTTWESLVKCRNHWPSEVEKYAESSAALE